MLDKLLSILTHISEIIAEGSSGKHVLQDIVAYLAKSLDVEVCSVYIYDPKSKELILKATRGLSLDSIDTVKMKPGEGLTGKSFSEKKILNLKNPEKHPDFIYFGETGEHLYHSFLSVPLIAGRQCVGIMVIQREKAERFSDIVVDMAKTLSSQLAHLIINTNMMRALSESNPEQPQKEEKSKKEQIRLKGFPLNTGVALGNAHIFTPALSVEKIEHIEIKDVESELKIFEEAVKITKEKTIELEQTAFSLISEIDAAIFNVHLLFLDDRALLDAVRKEIKENSHSVEFSLKEVFLKYEKQFNKMTDPVFREKVADLKDVILRLCETVQELKTGSHKPAEALLHRKNRIIVANELLPSDLMRLPFGKIDGIVCSKGGVAAHVSILAKALNIPAVVGVKKAMHTIKNGDPLILDSVSGLVYVYPSETIIAEFESSRKSTLREDEEVYKKGPAGTKDHHPVALRGNISLLCETERLQKFGATGIGLYRTEFLYMVRDFFPTEEEQFSVFKRIMNAAHGEPVTIRVLDIGSDKVLNYIHMPNEENPALGNRGIRLLLANKLILKEHLRAILRAGQYGKLKINFPMITTLSEILQVKQILKEVENDLHADNIEHAQDYQVGIMLEVPATYCAIERFLPHIDFMSIGTNDLQQYTFAVDRANADVAHLANPFNPVFLEMLDHIGKSFSKYPDKEIAVCGEMAGRPLAAPLIVGAGITDLSMTPSLIPQVRDAISVFTLDECRTMLNESVKMSHPEEVVEYLHSEFNKKNISIT